MHSSASNRDVMRKPLSTEENRHAMLPKFQPPVCRQPKAALNMGEQNQQNGDAAPVKCRDTSHEVFQLIPKEHATERENFGLGTFWSKEAAIARGLSWHPILSDILRRPDLQRLALCGGGG
jgi:hypothetical protein